MSLPDDRPLTDTQAADRMDEALRALGTAPGASVPGHTALEAARKCLALITWGLIAAG